MLTDLCAELKNYFLRGDNDIHAGVYEISGGSLPELPFLIDGQYFRIVGSVKNDGVYKYPTSELSDERFEGAIWAMAVPPAVIALSSEIDKWCEDNEGAINSPYTAESFGNYSYSKRQDGSSASGAISWQGQFAARLNKYRRLSVL